MGEIDQRYRLLGGLKSPLGPHADVERICADGTGRYRRYRQGCIYWHPETGANEVLGRIGRRWEELGREQGYLGYPLEGQLATPDGAGFIQRFQGGTILYWPASAVMDIPGTVALKKHNLPFRCYFQNLAMLPSTTLQTPYGEIGPLYRGDDHKLAVSTLLAFLRTARPDIVGLSEIWERSSKDLIVGELAGFYPYHQAMVSGDEALLDGGLLLLSHYPVKAHQATRFHHCLGEDCYGNKGALHARLEIPDSPAGLDLFLTHTQNPTPLAHSPNRGPGASGLEKVEMQLLQLATFIGMHTSPARPALLMGDLNVDGLKAGQYRDLLRRLEGPEDLWLTSNAAGWAVSNGRIEEVETSRGITFDAASDFYDESARTPAGNGRNREGKRIDYLLSYPGTRYRPAYQDTRTVALYTERGRDLSDHYGLMTEASGFIEMAVESRRAIERTVISLEYYLCLGMDGEAIEASSLPTDLPEMDLSMVAVSESGATARFPPFRIADPPLSTRVYPPEPPQVELINPGNWLEIRLAGGGHEPPQSRGAGGDQRNDAARAKFVVDHNDLHLNRGRPFNRIIHLEYANGIQCAVGLKFEVI